MLELGGAVPEKRGQSSPPLASRGPKLMLEKLMLIPFAWAWRAL